MSGLDYFETTENNARENALGLNSNEDDVAAEETVERGSYSPSGYRPFNTGALAPGGSQGKDPLGYYLILAVPTTADSEQIRHAYLMLSQNYHTDRHSQQDSEVQGYMTERFQQLTEAYEVLSDPRRRRAYDHSGAAGLTRLELVPRHVRQPYQYQDRGGDDNDDIEEYRNRQSMEGVHAELLSYRLGYIQRQQQERLRKDGKGRGRHILEKPGYFNRAGVQTYDELGRYLDLLAEEARLRRLATLLSSSSSTTMQLSVAHLLSFSLISKLRNRQGAAAVPSKQHDAISPPSSDDDGASSSLANENKGSSDSRNSVQEEDTSKNESESPTAKGDYNAEKDNDNPSTPSSAEAGEAPEKDDSQKTVEGNEPLPVVQPISFPGVKLNNAVAEVMIGPNDYGISTSTPQFVAILPEQAQSTLRQLKTMQGQPATQDGKTEEGNNDDAPKLPPGGDVGTADEPVRRPLRPRRARKLRGMLSQPLYLPLMLSTKHSFKHSLSQDTKATLKFSASQNRNDGGRGTVLMTLVLDKTISAITQVSGIIKCSLMNGFSIILFLQRKLSPLWEMRQRIGLFDSSTGLFLRSYELTLQRILSNRLVMENTWAMTMGSRMPGASGIIPTGSFTTNLTWVVSSRHQVALSNSVSKGSLSHAFNTVFMLFPTKPIRYYDRFKQSYQRHKSGKAATSSNTGAGEIEDHTHYLLAPTTFAQSLLQDCRSVAFHFGRFLHWVADRFCCLAMPSAVYQFIRSSIARKAAIYCDSPVLSFMSPLSDGFFYSSRKEGRSLMPDREDDNSDDDVDPEAQDYRGKLVASIRTSPLSGSTEMSYELWFFRTPLVQVGIGATVSIPYSTFLGFPVYKVIDQNSANSINTMNILSLLYARGDHTISVPIILFVNEGVSTALAVFWLPFLAATLFRLAMMPQQHRHAADMLHQLRVQFMEDSAAARRRAEIESLALVPVASRKRALEQQAQEKAVSQGADDDDDLPGGLVILEATYGVIRPGLELVEGDEDLPPLKVDVTDVLQSLVMNSLLDLADGNKARLPGFYDPLPFPLQESNSAVAPGADGVAPAAANLVKGSYYYNIIKTRVPLQLQIRYSYRGKEHYAFYSNVNDQRVSLPEARHRVN